MQRDRPAHTCLVAADSGRSKQTLWCIPRKQSEALGNRVAPKLGPPPSALHCLLDPKGLVDWKKQAQEEERVRCLGLLSCPRISPCHGWPICHPQQEWNRRIVNGLVELWISVVQFLLIVEVAALILSGFKLCMFRKAVTHIAKSRKRCCSSSSSIVAGIATGFGLLGSVKLVASRYCKWGEGDGGESPLY